MEGKEMTTLPASINNGDLRKDALITRRRLVEIAGVTLVGTAFLGTVGCAPAAPGQASLSPFPRVETGPVRAETVAGTQVGSLNGGTKPIYVTRPGSVDPVEHS